MKIRWFMLAGGVATLLTLGTQSAFARDAQTDIDRLDTSLTQAPNSISRQGYAPEQAATQLRDDAVAALNDGHPNEADRMARMGLHELGDSGAVAVEPNDPLVPNQVASGEWGMFPGIPASDLARGAAPGPQFATQGQAERPID